MAFTLKMGPMFTLIKSESGAASTDPTDYDLDNYPLEKVVVSMGNMVQFYWTGEGAVPADNIDIEVIAYDASNLCYLPLETFSAVVPSTLTEVDTKGYPFYITVAGVNVTSVDNLKIFAAFSLDPPRRSI
jgi:hypothetical protein